MCAHYKPHMNICIFRFYQLGLIQSKDELCKCTTRGVKKYLQNLGDYSYLLSCLECDEKIYTLMHLCFVWTCSERHKCWKQKDIAICFKSLLPLQLTN